MTKCMKMFYGSTSIDNSDFEDTSVKSKIELEYYQLCNGTSSKPYGVEIVKKQIENNIINIEYKILENICNKEQDTNKLLQILISNKVTPIAVEDIVQDLMKLEAI